MFSLVMYLHELESCQPFSVIVYIVYPYLAHTRYRSLHRRLDTSFQTTRLTQRLIAELFDVDVRTISEHLGNIFSSGELERDSVIRKFRITASDGKRYAVQHYSLDAIISVGYRVNSVRATQFRQWATSVLRDFDRLEQPSQAA